MKKKLPSRRRLIAEPIEPRLLFSASADLSLLDDSYSEYQSLLELAEKTDLSDVLEASPALNPVNEAIDTSAISDVYDIQGAVDPGAREVFSGEIVFVDTSVNDYELLIDDIFAQNTNADYKVILIDSQQSGVEQISTTLAGLAGVSAMHIISHGDEGKLQLGNHRIDIDSVQSLEAEISQWADALNDDADMLIYGCNLAKNAEGVALLESLSSYTQTDIAASDDFTGSGSREQSDWTLEYQSGEVETQSLISDNSTVQWSGLLANVTPTLTINSITINEGQALRLTGANFSASDPDDVDSTLTFHVTGIANASFQLVADGSVIYQFTQAQIANDEIQFVSANGVMPTYQVRVEDDDGASTAFVDGNITFTPQINDAPVFGNNQLSLGEGDTVVLNASNLSATDIDDHDQTLVFHVNSVSNGQFQWVSNGLSISSFTQAQLLAGNVQFVHDGSDNPPAYTITVSDPEGASTSPDAATISFTSSNDTPTLVNNSLTITEGETVILGASNFSATDSDDDDNTLVFSINSVSNGQFQWVSSGFSVSSFTQAQLLNDEVQFVHNGTENPPTYSISVADDELASTTPAAGAISYTPLNDPPVLFNNTLTLNAGDSITLNGSNFSATDIDDDDNTIIFNVTSVLNGSFQRVLDNTVITSFNQGQLLAGEIKFVHNGTNNAPSFLVSVSDDELAATTPAATTIVFTPGANATPVLVNNQLTVNEGQTVVLNSGNFSATDSDDADSTLVFDVSNVLHGSFQLSSNGSTVTSFSQAQISNGDIQFVHDGSENAPSYELHVRDDEFAATTPVAGTVTFVANDNDTPTLGNNQLTVNEGQTVVLNSGNFSATDSDDADSTLVFDVSNVMHGSFQLVSNGSTVTSFSQAQISNGDIQFVHDGSENAPSYGVSVRDDEGAISATAAAAITFSADVNDIPVMGNNQLVITEGATVVLTLANISAMDLDSNDAVVGGFNGLYSVSSVINGSFQLTADGSTVNSFTHQQVVSGQIQFVHDGSESPPSYLVRVADADGGISVASSAAITFSAINDRPVVVGSIGDLSTDEGELFSYTFADTLFSDEEGDPLIYRAEIAGTGELPAWLQFDSSTRTFSGTPAADDIGLYSILLIAVDSSAAESDPIRFQIEVNAVNDAPTAGILPSIGLDEDAGETIVSLASYFADEEDSSTELTYSVVSASDASLFESLTINASGDLSLNYAANQHGTSVITIRAVDSGGKQVESTLSVSLVSINDIPTTSGLDDIAFEQAELSGSTIDLGSFFADIEDGSNMVYSVVSNSNPEITELAAIDSQNQQLVLRYDPLSFGETNIVVRAMDSDGAFIDSSFKVLVSQKPLLVNPEQPPIVELPEVDPDPDPDTPPEPEDDLIPEDANLGDGDTNEQAPASGGAGESALTANEQILASAAATPSNFVSTSVDFFAEENKAESQKLYFETMRTADKDESDDSAAGIDSTLANLIAVDGTLLSAAEIDSFNHELKRFKADMNEAIVEEEQEKMLYSGVTMSITTGLLVWGLRAGSFLLTLFSALPIVKGLDPLPVISAQTKRLQQQEQERDKKKEDKRRREVGYMFDK